jgi:apolipoprotein N-acyltransferase
MTFATGRWRIASGYAALGAAMAAGQAPLGAFWVTLPALAVLFAVLPLGADARAWGGRLWAAGSGYFAASLFWIIEPFLIEPEIHGWMAPFALILMAGGMAAFWALAGWGAARLAQGRARLVALAALLLALELARGHVFGGFPWAMLGHVLIDTPLRALAAYAGAGGLERAGRQCGAGGCDGPHHAGARFRGNRGGRVPSRGLGLGRGPNRAAP